MTDDPDKEPRSTIFKFDSYPRNYTATNPIDWSQIPIGTQQNNQNTLREFQYNLNNERLSMGNFQFCTSQTPSPVQFPFETNSPIEFQSQRRQPSSSSIHLRCKRKTDTPFSFKRTKQHITEDKMIEYMSKLRISSETATTSQESDSLRNRRLYMCEEMRKLQTDSILPQAILSKFQRPCTALVLWKPPRRLIDINENNPNPRKNDLDSNNMDLDSVE